MSTPACAQVLVAGSANLDFVVRAARIPSPGETVLGSEFQTFPGGKGANQAVASARAGAATRMLLALGDDAFAPPIERSLREAGVALRVARQPQLPTGCAFISLSDTGENAIIVAPGANAALRAEDLDTLDGVGLLLLQLETPLPTVTALARRAHALGIQVLLNAAPAQALPRELLAAVDVLVLNEGELRAVSPPSLALEEAMACHAVPTVIVTQGAAGCCVLSGRQSWRQPAFAIEVVDTTAAGDTFCGALVAALAEGLELRAALTRAAAAAALACTRLGAQPSIPLRAEIDAFLQTHA